MLDDQALSEDDDRFPVLELPDVVLANVLRWCPPGSIAGFALPLALAQIRLTGSVDPHWLRPLLRVASKCPAVLDHLSRHLRSIEFLDWYNERYPAIMPQLTRLESLEYSGIVSLSHLSALPISLTKLSVKRVDLEGGSLEDFSALLLRLTALEDLDVGRVGFNQDWTLDGMLLQLRRLKLFGLPTDLGTFAPNLETVEGRLYAQYLERLPITLTEMRFVGTLILEGSLLPVARLTGLKDLGLPSGALNVSELPEVLRGLKDLRRLKIGDDLTSDNLPELLDALDNGPKDLDICLHDVILDDSSSAVERLFGQVVEVNYLQADNPASLPWAALTRLTRLVLDVDGSKDAGWVQPLSQLPNLKDLEVWLRDQPPEGFRALTQCTQLLLWNIKSTTNLSCLQHLTRLGECDMENVPVECLGALPDCLTKLHAESTYKSPDLPLGAALQHLTALEDLTIQWSPGEDRVCDLSALSRLTRLALESVPMPLVRLGVLPCLREVWLTEPGALDSGMTEQLGRLPSLRRLIIYLYRKGVCGVDNQPGTWRSQEIGQVPLPANLDPASAIITAGIWGELSGFYFPPYQHYGNVQLTDGTNIAVLDTSAPGTTPTSFESSPDSYDGFISAPAAPSPGAFLPGAILTVAVHQYCEYWRYVSVMVEVNLDVTWSSPTDQ